METKYKIGLTKLITEMISHFHSKWNCPKVLNPITL